MLVFEDDHLLVINKPPGINTHAPSPYAGEGIYDWLKHREPRWASLAIIHRLDKETSGILIFTKTPLANRSLTDQFTRRSVAKKYLLLTDRAVPQPDLTVESDLVRVGDRYKARPSSGIQKGEWAQTRFHVIASQQGKTTLEAQPVTGRTHQIRVHAASSGFPVLGDRLYEGSPAPRLCLHAHELTIAHPVTREKLAFSAPADFETPSALQLRHGLFDPEKTNAYRIIHGAADAWPGWYVDRLGPYLISQAEAPLRLDNHHELSTIITHLARAEPIRGVYHKILTRHLRQTVPKETSPVLVQGEPVPSPFLVRENGVQFEVSFGEGYSVGLFLDQRDNRRRILTQHVSAGFSLSRPNAQLHVLNTFAYTCGFSLCGALAGAKTTSIDLSKKYLEWGKRNFVHNGLSLQGHDFFYGDVFDWLKRLAKARRQFDLVILDPPTFSQSRVSGVFKATSHYPRLIKAALPLLKSGGVLFASSNAADWPPQEFVPQIETAITSARWRILQKHYVPQPLDFHVTPAEPAYLKTIWLKLEKIS